MSQEFRVGSLSAMFLWVFVACETSSGETPDGSTRFDAELPVDAVTTPNDTGAGGRNDAALSDASDSRDVAAAPDAGLAGDLNDSFDGDGPLLNYVTNNPSALPDVARVDGRYRANLVDNTDNVTLHFNQDQGRLDAKLVTFPFEIVVRNIGIGTQANSQVAPAPERDPYLFAGVQVHVTALESRNSSHVVVGHRGGAHFTVEGKNTVDGDSRVNDVGFGAVPDGRADLRIVGNADRTLSVYWQTPNLTPETTSDDWRAYGADGRLPGPAPDYGETVYVGLITYAFGSAGVPFVGTCDAIEQR